MKISVSPKWRKRWQWVLIIIGILAVLSLIATPIYYYYNDFHKNRRSTDPSDWGPFGDYFGGILNPILSFLTLVVTIIIAFVIRQIEMRGRKEDREAGYEPQLVAEQTTFYTYVGARYNKKKPVAFSVQSLGAKVADLQLPNPFGIDIYNIGLGPAKNVQLKYEIDQKNIADHIGKISAFLDPVNRLVVLSQKGLVRFEYPAAWGIGGAIQIGSPAQVKSLTHILNVTISDKPYNFRLPQFFLEMYTAYQYVWMEQMQVDAKLLPDFPEIFLNVSYDDIGRRWFKRRFKIELRSLSGGREFLNEIVIEQVDASQGVYVKA